MHIYVDTSNVVPYNYNFQVQYDTTCYDMNYRMDSSYAFNAIDPVLNPVGTHGHSVKIHLDYLNWSIESMYNMVCDLGSQVSANATALQTLVIESEAYAYSQAKIDINDAISAVRVEANTVKNAMETRYGQLIAELREEKATLQTQFVELCRAIATDDMEEARQQAKKHLLNAWIDREIADQERIDGVQEHGR